MLNSPDPERPRLPNSYYQDDQTKNAPGGNRHKKAAKAEATKGQTGEKRNAGKLGGRVNSQRAWDSTSNPDITAGQFDIENKTGHISIRKELDEIVKKTPFPRKPGLIFDHNGEWIAVRLDDHVPFAKYVAEKEGYYMIPAGKLEDE